MVARVRALTIGVLAVLWLVPAAADRGDGGPADFAQSPAPAPTFKADVEYVEVDAVVTDKAGNVVRGLTKDDFTVREDGKPQAIASFSFVDIPAPPTDTTPGPGAAIAPDVASNARPFDGRVYVAVIDDLEVSASRTGRAAAAAERFVQDDLGPGDVMAVIHTMGGPHNAQVAFTGDKPRLLAAIRGGSGLSLRENNEAMTPEIGKDLDAERAHAALAALQTVGSVAAWFSTIRNRRKAILFFSDGINYDFDRLVQDSARVDRMILNPGGEVLEPTAYAEDIVQGMSRLIATAARENVAIYGIDPQGLPSNRSDLDIAEQTGSVEQRARNLGLQSTYGAQLQRAQDSLRILSNQTGGFAIVNRNDFANAYRRIVADNSSYYVLAYYPAIARHDGKFHKIEVRVDRPGMTVRARRGYLVPKEKASSKVAADTTGDIQAALSSPLPVSGLTMDVFAAPFEAPAPNDSVLLGAELHGSDLALSPGDRLQLSFLAIDAAGKTVDDETVPVTVNLDEGGRTRVQRTGLRLLNRLTLPPGRYELRVATRDAASGKTGSVLYQLDVPDFRHEPLVLSGVVLTSALGAAMPTPRPDAQLRTILPAPPVALRQFPQNDAIVVYGEAYDNAPTPPHTVDLTTTVTGTDGRELFKTAVQRNSSELHGNGYGFTARVPMAGLAVGSYVLTVEARVDAGDPHAVARQIPFSVTSPISVGREQ